VAVDVPVALAPAERTTDSMVGVGVAGGVVAIGVAVRLETAAARAAGVVVAVAPLARLEVWVATVTERTPSSLPRSAVAVISDAERGTPQAIAASVRKGAMIPPSLRAAPERAKPPPRGRIGQL
jgi:hypothetical protein